MGLSNDIQGAAVSAHDVVHGDTQDDAHSLGESEALIARLLPLAKRSADMQEHLAEAWFRKIAVLEAMGRHAEIGAEVNALCAHFDASSDSNAASPTSHWLARAMCEQALSLITLGEDKAALTMLETVQRRFDADEASPALREWLAIAGLEEGRLRARMGATFARVDMVRHAQWLINRFGGDEWPATRVAVARTRA